MSTTTATRYVSSWERATTFQADAAEVTIEQLRDAAAVLSAIADVDLRPLERAMACDPSGNPITSTPEQTEAWSTYCEAMDVRDRADGWARVLLAAAGRRDTVPPVSPEA